MLFIKLRVLLGRLRSLYRHIFHRWNRYTVSSLLSINRQAVEFEPPSRGFLFQTNLYVLSLSIDDVQHTGMIPVFYTQQLVTSLKAKVFQLEQPQSDPRRSRKVWPKNVQYTN